MSVSRRNDSEYERWTELVDRRACDEPLSAAELEFVQEFERKHPACTHELASYAELGDLQLPPDATSRTLVERVLARIEAEDAARAVDEVRLLRKPRVAGWLVACAAVAAAAVGLIVLRASRSSDPSALPNTTPPALARAELVYASGAVDVSGATARVGHTLLEEGCVIETHDGEACVLIDADINVCLAANSRMRLRTIAAPARRVELEQGKLATRLATQPEGMSLSIDANGVSSVAVGTAFSVERDGDSTVVTTVLNGKVKVGRHGGQDDHVFVNAHERAVSGSKQRVVTAVSRTDEAPSWALLGPTALWHDPVAATLEVHGEPSGAEAWLDDQRIGVAPLSSLIPVGDHQLVVRKGGEELLSRELHVRAGDAHDISYGPLRALDQKHTSQHPARAHNAAERRGEKRGEEARSEPAEPMPTGAELLRQARQEVRSGHFAQAAGSYQQLIESYAGSDEAQTALVLLGQLRLTQLADPKGALAPLNAYLQEGGSLEVEARVARIEALHALHRENDEASAIEDFLHRHPRSFEAKRLRARLAVLRDTP